MVDVLMPFLTPIKSLVLCIGWHSDVKKGIKTSTIAPRDENNVKIEIKIK